MKKYCFRLDCGKVIGSHLMRCLEFARTLKKLIINLFLFHMIFKRNN